MMQSTLDPACTGLFSKLFLDYIHKNEDLKPFYHEFPSIENFGKTITQKEFSPEIREILITSLSEQYEGLDKGKVLDNIERLRSEKTFTVTTGHQLNLMTGPSFFIYKIVSTILLTEQLKRAYPEYHFVPVYWMASEDHDFAEINHFYFDGKKYQWETEQNGPVGEFFLDKELKALISEWEFLPEFFKSAYQSSETLKEAVRKYVHHLFSHKGLVILDANDKNLKRCFLSVIKDDVITQKANVLVNGSNKELESLGYKTQVFPREINFFYMRAGLRERIVEKDGKFQVLNTDFVWDEDGMIKEMEEHPEKFSPNVVMRPLYQETILPNLAYLGGPAEIAYWFQLKGVFEHYGTDFPILLPRNFAMVLPVETHRKMAKLELELEDIFKPMDQLRKQYVLDHASEDLTLSKEKQDLELLFKDLAEKSIELDITLENAVKAAHHRSEKIINQVANKFRKAEEKKKRTSIRQLLEVKEKLFPGNVPQERKVNFLEYFLSDPDFINKLLNNFDPLDFNFIILRQDGIKRSSKKEV